MTPRDFHLFHSLQHYPRSALLCVSKVDRFVQQHRRRRAGGGGGKFTVAMTPGGWASPVSEKRATRLYAAWLSFAISSYLPVKAEFHVSSKIRQAGGCDTSRKIECVCVMRIVCMGDECVLAKRRDKV
ncbi:hypothetical protein ALC56_04285 [Trachymyrmex septentrionalis]|uniref:Uncharacterized protein n=1 Tax=Trachymyrmex septentrionalis TaxID=34720 RepID=A0A195FME5_9HYME|nr:hypothetical protein ALC56_04285 [Trachymyrmex septentrionalis]